MKGSNSIGVVAFFLFFFQIFNFSISVRHRMRNDGRDGVDGKGVLATGDAEYAPRHGSSLIQSLLI